MVLNDTLGAPAVDTPAEAPTPVAPLKAMTVSDWSKPVLDDKADTVTLFNELGASAHHTSEVPG